MKNLSWRKASLLGVVLVAASAVIAAVLPSNNNNPGNMQANGTLDPTNDGGANNTATCNPVASGATCVDSATSGANSTTTGINDSTGLGGLNTEEGSVGD